MNKSRLQTAEAPMPNGHAGGADLIATMNARRGMFRDALRAPERASQQKTTRNAAVDARAAVAHDTQGIWLSVGKSLADQWWQRHPARIAVRLAESVVAIEAKQHPLRLLAIGVSVGAAVVVLAPWRRVGITSVLASVIAANTSGLLTQALALSKVSPTNTNADNKTEIGRSK
jgi:hypothetical protein